LLRSVQQNTSSVSADLDEWLAPFLKRFRVDPQRRWAPVYVRGLIAPGERKSVEPMADRVAPGQTQQLHHFVSTSQWPVEPIEEVLLQKADALVGGSDSHLIVDDTAIPKKGKHSAGVEHQYCGQLGKQASCQSLVSITLAKGDVPIPIALRLFLPKSWDEDQVRRTRAGIPAYVRHRPKWQIALAEIRRIRSQNVRFGSVLADAGYGACAEFRHALTEMGLLWAVGISSEQLVYPRSVRVRAPVRGSRGRPAKHGTTTAQRRSVREAIEDLGARAFETITWRRGTKGDLVADFAATRIRVADGAKATSRIHLPGDVVWLVCERRRGGEVKYHLTNHPETVDLHEIVATIKARWSCEQAHQQMKEELGLDHFEGRSWLGLHHHAVMTMVAFCYLQQRRLSENKPSA